MEKVGAIVATQSIFEHLLRYDVRVCHQRARDTFRGSSARDTVTQVQHKVPGPNVCTTYENESHISFTQSVKSLGSWEMDTSDLDPARPRNTHHHHSSFIILQQSSCVGRVRKSELLRSYHSACLFPYQYEDYQNLFFLTVRHESMQL